MSIYGLTPVTSSRTRCACPTSSDPDTSRTYVRGTSQVYETIHEESRICLLFIIRARWNMWRDPASICMQAMTSAGINKKGVHMKKGLIGLAVTLAGIVFVSAAVTQDALYAGDDVHGKRAAWGKGDHGTCLSKGERYMERGGRFVTCGSNFKGSGEKSVTSQNLKMLLRHSKELGLTDVQVEKIADIKRTLVKERIAMKAQVRILDVDIRALAKNDTVDVEKIRPLIEKKYEAKKELGLKEIMALADAKKVLTPEQLKKAKELAREKRRACTSKGKKPLSRRA